MRRILLALALPVLLLACSQRDKEAAGPKHASKRLRIFALDEMRSSGFEGVVMKDYGRKYNCAVDLVLFPDLSALMQAVREENNTGQVDLVLGIDNAWAASDTLPSPFQPVPNLKIEHLNRDVPLDRERLLIPYAYSNLAIIYNQKIYPDPPGSFGELQDARFYSQLALCDPKTSGLGRCTLLWSLALFGENGYQQLWLSLRKNVRKPYAGQMAAWEALKKGECNLMLGFISTPAWAEELNQSEKTFKHVIPDEGSFQYTEAVALLKDAPNRDTALKFIDYLLLPDTQRQVMYKLGLLPVNSRTPLGIRFASLPLSVFTMNGRLDPAQIRYGWPSWQEFWDQLFVLGRGLYVD
jgi:ABC transporter substrate-binding protein (ThiB subfamily)